MVLLGKQFKQDKSRLTEKGSTANFLAITVQITLCTCPVSKNKDLLPSKKKEKQTYSRELFKLTNSLCVNGCTNSL